MYYKNLNVFFFVSFYLGCLLYYINFFPTTSILFELYNNIMSMIYSPFEINYMEYLKSIISTSCHIIVSYYIVKADYMVPGWYQSITNIVCPSSNMIAQGIIFCKTIKDNCYDRLVSINIISLSLS